MSTALQDFVSLLNKFNLRLTGTLPIGETGYLDRPVKNSLFAGVDKRLRPFVNIPFTVRASTPRLEAWLTRRDSAWASSALVVFQRHPDNPEHFVIGGELPPITCTKVLGEGPSVDFSVVDRLLRGETIRFYFGQYDGKGVWQKQKADWIEATLKQADAQADAA